MSLFGGARLDIPCEVDLERSLDSFHAYAIPGIDVRPGDTVIVHGMPSRLAFGECRQFTTRATIIRAGWLARLWTEIAGMFELTGLYEVGFLPAHELVLQPRDAR